MLIPSCSCANGFQLQPCKGNIVKKLRKRYNIGQQCKTTSQALPTLERDGTITLHKGNIVKNIKNVSHVLYELFLYDKIGASCLAFSVLILSSLLLSSALFVMLLSMLLLLSALLLFGIFC